MEGRSRQRRKGFGGPWGTTAGRGGDGDLMGVRQNLQALLRWGDAGPFPAPIVRKSSRGLVEMELLHIPAWSADIYQGNKRIQPDHKTG